MIQQHCQKFYFFVDIVRKVILVMFITEAVVCYGGGLEFIILKVVQIVCPARECK